MRLPPLPKHLKTEDLLFYRRKRYNKDQMWVEFSVYNKKNFLGILSYNWTTDDLTLHQLLKSKTKATDTFFELLHQWKCEQQYLREMKDIINERI